MSALEITFWISVAVVAYTYIGYPALLAALARWRAHPVQRVRNPNLSVSIIICANNEGAGIVRRVRELSDMLDANNRTGEIIVVSDGSTDDTVTKVKQLESDRIRLIAFDDNIGKAAALNLAHAEAKYEIMVLADVRQRWNESALTHMLENFADPGVGAVSGELVLESAPGILAGVGFYWHFEKWMRRRESEWHSMVQVTGAICAVRRALFRHIPPGTLVDDMYWPLQVAKEGYRVVHDECAVAYDCLPHQSRDEFQRKVRTLSGNFQMLGRMPSLLFPWSNPVWWQWISHKLLRLFVPWALLAMFVCCLILRQPIYRILLAVQCYAYAVALIGWVTPIGRRERLMKAACSFVILNAAAFVAFWVWISGRAGQSWKKVHYRPIRTILTKQHDSVTAPPL